MESDLTEKEREQARLIERAKREWEASVDALPQLICLLDRQQQVVRANRTIERWGLGQVIEIRGKNVHSLLHGGCSDPECYLISFLKRVWTELPQAQSMELEADDIQLKRYIHLQIQPILTPLPHSAEENGSSQSFAVLVLSDITKQKQAELALHEYAAELKAHNEELDAFAHTVAHNLKGSLLPMIGFAELIRDFYDRLPPDRIQRELSVIAQSGHKMSKIIDELLLLAGVRKMRVEMTPLDMGAIMGEVQQRLAPMLGEYGAELILPEPSTWPVALGYGPWVEEVWVNYLSNGMKYGGQPPRLELGASPSMNGEKAVRFWVRDNGPGLTPEEQAKLFVPFTQLSQIYKGGHGLGLSIVQRIVAKLGGMVEVTSEGIPGQGCTFSFTLPSATPNNPKQA
ncbi:MAG: ATP-binding protein [Anaerolineae bacterium]